MKKIGIFYGSSGGNTEDVANKLAEKLDADVFNVADKPDEKLSDYENLIFGTSTWGVGELQEDWEDFITAVENADLSGKVIAIYAFGDSETYADTFVDSLKIIYDVLEEKNCKITGFTDAQEYDYEDSASVIDGKFVGLPLDEENEGEMTDERVDKWIDKITKEFK